MSPWYSAQVAGRFNDEIGAQISRAEGVNVGWFGLVNDATPSYSLSLEASGKEEAENRLRDALADTGHRMSAIREIKPRPPESQP